MHASTKMVMLMTDSTVRKPKTLPRSEAVSLIEQADVHEMRCAVAIIHT